MPVIYHTIFVTDRDRVLRSELETPEKVDPDLCCLSGVVQDGGKLFVREVASKNLLLISDSSAKIAIFGLQKKITPRGVVVCYRDTVTGTMIVTQ